MKRVVIVHGWGGTPDTGWFPWLKNELEAVGFEVVVPQLPHTNEPRVDAWVEALAEAVEKPDADTYFVAHSLGCQTVVRYLEMLPEGVRVGGAVFVAGFFRPLTNISRHDREIEEEWLARPIGFRKVRDHLRDSVAIFSSDDAWVPVENAEDFEENLKSDTLVVEKCGHFNEGAGFTTLPIALEKLLSLVRY